MSSGPLPPLPDLIPISALRRSSPGGGLQPPGGQQPTECAAAPGEVMGEQRPQRTIGQAPAASLLIDSARSRDVGAAPRAPQSRKASSSRHRKSDRRRDRPRTTRSGNSSRHNNNNNNNDNNEAEAEEDDDDDQAEGRGSARRSRSRHHQQQHQRRRRRRRPSSTTSPASSQERPINARVKPIFVWVRQDNTRIVDVKCEDYDKRNRILLTKTAQGWRAIPRTETLVPSLREVADQHPPGRHHHHHHRNRKSRRNRVKRRSTAVQVESDDIQDTDDTLEDAPGHPSSPSWSSPVNIESHLPSHKIHIHRKKSPAPQSPSATPDIESANVNNVVCEPAQTPQIIQCSAGKICDVTPLDNLLAVAELEFNQQIQSGEWEKSSSSPKTDIIDSDNHKQFEDIVTENNKEFIDNMEQLSSFIESCAKNNETSKIIEDDFSDNPREKTEECDYTEDDDNNLAMDDILSRLEQSLRSPESTVISDALNDCDTNFDSKIEDFKEMECITNDIGSNEFKIGSEEFEKFFENDKSSTHEEQNNTAEPEAEADSQERDDVPVEEENVCITDLETTNCNEVDENEEPTDLTMSKHSAYDTEENAFSGNESEEPTDLSIPKHADSPPRPPSQNSEAIQSPQPSGIPAVPPSPDIVTQSNSTSKSKSVFLESLLSATSQKLPQSTEVTVVRQKEPLDLGKCRKSASPTVTCSEEVKINNIDKDDKVLDLEPPPKKFKPVDDITLKTLLDVEVANKNDSETYCERNNRQETPKLLELLKNDSELDPLAQLRQLLKDKTLNIPDPMLVPKEKLSLIISNPGREIPRLLKQRPELRLPEALSHPNLLQDPDILVITLLQLETIVQKQNQALPFEECKLFLSKTSQEKQISSKKSDSHHKPDQHSKETQLKKKASDDAPAKSNNVQFEQPNKNNACINELASDIDAATTAAFNQMMWLPYLNQLDAMSSFGNNIDVMKMLNNAVPMYPGQVPDLSHLFGPTRFPPPIGFPMQPPIGYNNPLEMNVWQEAMMQANMLRPKVSFENLNPKNSFREYLDKLNFPTTAKKSMPHSSHNSHNQRSVVNNSVNSSKPNHNNSYYPMSSNGFQNSYMNMQNSYQPSSSKHGIQLPQANGMGYLHKNSSNPIQNQAKSSMSNYYSKNQMKFDSMCSIPNYSHHRLEENKHMTTHKSQDVSQHKPKLVCKPFANISHHKTHSHQREMMKEKQNSDFSKQQTSQPIDLSGATTPGGNKLKSKQHFTDSASTSKLLKHDEVPEVGSTTASIEEMQDAHNHLWHPLFGK